VVVDYGCKDSTLRELLRCEVSIVRVPWNYDFLDLDFQDVPISYLLEWIRNHGTFSQ